MIHKIYPSLNDFENLSRLKVQSSDFANNFDYSNVVVNKPWGYEYLWYQNDNVAIWFLYIEKGSSTSLHCHAKKRTSLIVLDGEIICTSLDDKYKLLKSDSIVLEPCVFHSSMSISDNGSFIMEIETPPMKGDLVRMNDSYGRENSGYENTNEYSKDFDLFEFVPFNTEKSKIWEFRNLEIQLVNENIIFSKNIQMIVPISGNIESDIKVEIECGEAFSIDKDFISTIKKNINHQFLIFNKK
jgi:mannose-6-phosphate isomerase-like protein (cupin superfamily)